MKKCHFFNDKTPTPLENSRLRSFDVRTRHAQVRGGAGSVPRRRLAGVGSRGREKSRGRRSLSRDPPRLEKVKNIDKSRKSPKVGKKRRKKKVETLEKGQDEESKKKNWRKHRRGEPLRQGLRSGSDRAPRGPPHVEQEAQRPGLHDEAQDAADKPEHGGTDASLSRVLSFSTQDIPFFPVFNIRKELVAMCRRFGDPDMQQVLSFAMGIDIMSRPASVGQYRSGRTPLLKL